MALRISKKYKFQLPGFGGSFILFFIWFSMCVLLGFFSQKVSEILILPGGFGLAVLLICNIIKTFDSAFNLNIFNRLKNRKEKEG